jgi:uncharacterized membrane protein YedE/YeeE
VSREGKQGALALASGALFGVGLVLGGMTKPPKVIGFLDLGGAWDPSLAFVMLGAVGVYALASRLIAGKPAPLLAAPLLADKFVLPARRRIDARLVSGAALFGIGWGLAGYCPGPAIVSLASASPGVVLFVAAMLVGMLVTGKLEGRHSAPSSARPTRSDSAVAQPPTMAVQLTGRLEK